VSLKCVRVEEKAATTILLIIIGYDLSKEVKKKGCCFVLLDDISLVPSPLPIVGMEMHLSRLFCRHCSL